MRDLSSPSHSLLRHPVLKKSFSTLVCLSCFSFLFIVFSFNFTFTSVLFGEKLFGIMTPKWRSFLCALFWDQRKTLCGHHRERWFGVLLPHSFLLFSSTPFSHLSEILKQGACISLSIVLCLFCKFPKVKPHYATLP